MIASSKPIPNNEPAPLIQKMDQDVLKAMMDHKIRIISCFLNKHPNAIKCCDGECEHEKIGNITRKITVTDNTVGLVDVDLLSVCVYTMPILGHLIDHELFSSFLSADTTKASE
jgi:hypothetical protein